MLKVWGSVSLRQNVFIRSGPGLETYFQITVCDLRTVSFDVPPQEILTKDSVTVAVDAVVYYKIEQPMSAVINIADYATRLDSNTILMMPLAWLGYVRLAKVGLS